MIHGTTKAARALLNFHSLKLEKLKKKVKKYAKFIRNQVHGNKSREEN